MFFDSFPQSDIDVVAPDGEVRHTGIKALVDSKSVTIPDGTITVVEGDEIRRRLPNGREEAFQVLEAHYSDDFHGIPAHYQVKTRKKGEFARKTGGNYTINVTGPNSRVNLNSQDHSHNQVVNRGTFEDLRGAIASISNEKHRECLQMRVADLEYAGSKEEQRSAFQKLIAAAPKYMEIIAPFIPAISKMFAS